MSKKKRKGSLFGGKAEEEPKLDMAEEEVKSEDKVEVSAEVDAAKDAWIDAKLEAGGEAPVAEEPVAEAPVEAPAPEPEVKLEVDLDTLAGAPSVELPAADPAEETAVIDTAPSGVAIGSAGDEVEEAMFAAQAEANKVKLAGRAALGKKKELENNVSTEVIKGRALFGEAKFDECIALLEPIMTKDSHALVLYQEAKTARKHAAAAAE